MSEPLVTVCVPTIGRTAYLKTALHSLRQQTFPLGEVLILDNASGPDAQLVLADFVATTPNARVLRVDERVPMFANFNRGLRAARGKYVVFFHDDDVYQPTFLERHVALLEAHPRAAFAAGNFDVIDGDGCVTGRRRGIAKTALWDGRYFIERLFRRGVSDLPTPGLVFRRCALDANGFDERLPVNWGDFTVLMRMAEHWNVAVLVEPLYAWRNHGLNGSSIAWSRTMTIRTGVLQDYCAEYEARHPDESGFVSRLRRYVGRSVLRTFAWGWLTAPDAAEAIACRDFLQRYHPRTARLLQAAERAGITIERRQTVMPAVRRIARRLRS